MSESKIKLTTAILALLGVTIISTMGLVYFENWSVFSALWVTVVSLTTTGYGDIVPLTTAGRLFLLVMLVAGVGVVAYSLGIIISIFVESQISRIMERNKMMHEIKKLNNHIIVCGAGRVGNNVAYILRKEKAPYVLIDTDEELVEHMRQEGHLVMQGNATEDEVLLAAGIEKASGVVCALPEDAYNVFIVLTARAIKPSLKIVARAERLETVDKLRRAGADKVIAPAQIGGQQLAMAILKPATVEMVDTLFTSRNMELQLEEVIVDDTSNLANKPIKDIFIREKTSVMVVAIIRGDQVIMSPKGADVIQSQDTLVVMGSRKDLEKIETNAFGQTQGKQA